MSREPRGTIGFLIGCCLFTVLVVLFSDVIKSAAVNQYISGELKCVPDAFEPETLVCRSSVGK